MACTFPILIELIQLSLPPASPFRYDLTPSPASLIPGARTCAGYPGDGGIGTDFMECDVPWLKSNV